MTSGGLILMIVVSQDWLRLGLITRKYSLAIGFGVAPLAYNFFFKTKGLDIVQNRLLHGSDSFVDNVGLTSINIAHLPKPVLQY